MKSLINKNFSQFLLCVTIILIGCAPLFFFIMKYCYTKDLDELIVYRYNEFLEETLPRFNVSEIKVWNKYNEDIQILPYADSYILGKTVEEFLFNKAEGHNIDYRILYEKVEMDGKPYILMSRIPMIETNDLLRNLFAQYGLIFIVLLSSIAIVQRVLSKKLWAAFYNSLSKIENYRLEQENVPEFEKTDIIEFARLNELLSSLISNNRRVYMQQKEFIENASHELQTPLAVFSSKLDVLLQDANLTESQSEAIQLLYDSSSRLTRLNKNLLLLAKIDNFQFRKAHDIDFAEMLNNQLAYLKVLAENNGLNVSVEINHSLRIHANTTLVESLINNLIVNAIRHNVSNGSIFIAVNKDTFTIRNTGDASPLNKDRIFRRFSRPSEEKKGNGLGLSIVSQICNLHGWSIEYSNRNSLHIFTVRFV